MPYVLLLLFSLLLSCPVLAADYYAATTGSGSTCSYASPCSASTVMTKPVAGDFVYFRGGTYDVGQSPDFQTPALNPSNSGTSGNYITFTSYTGEMATFKISDSCTGEGCQAAIGARSRNYIVWDGVTIDQSTGNLKVKGLQIRDSSYCIVRNCIFIGQTTTYSDNYEGLRLENADYAHVYNNLIYGYLNTNETHNTSGIKAYYTDNSIIEKNTVHSGTAGIYMKGGDNSYNTIRYNLIYDVNNAGILYSYSQYDNVYQNVIYYANNGIDITDSKVLYCNFYNNTMYNLSNGSYKFGVNYWYNASDIQHSNNTFINNIVHTATTRAFYISNAHSGWSEIDYNYYYSHGGFVVDGSAVLWAAWNGTYSYDLHGVNGVDPLLTDPLNANFHLQAGSPCLSGGKGGLYSSVIGAYITGSECIGYGCTESASATITSRGCDMHGGGIQ